MCALMWLPARFAPGIPTLALLGGLLLTAGAQPGWGQAGKTGQPLAPKLPVSKETTYITSPLTRDGYIDYQTALNDRLSKDVVPEKNACIPLWLAFGPRPENGPGMPAEFYHRLGIVEPPREGAYFLGLSAFARDQLKVPPAQVNTTAYDLLSRAGKQPWMEGDHPVLASWLKANERPLAVVLEASRRPDYFQPLVCPPGQKGLHNAPLPAVQKSRELGSALVSRAMLRLGQGKPDQAWEDLLACHRLSRLVARSSTIIETLVAVALNSLASQAELVYLERANLTAQQIQDRLKDLQGLPPLPRLADKIELGERFLYLDTVQGLYRDSGGPLAALFGNPWEAALRDGNQWYDRIAAALRLPDRADRQKALDTIETDLKRKQQAAPGQAITLIRQQIPAVRKGHDACDRAEQEQRNLHVAFALAGYHRDQGRYPDQLDELAPRYLAVVPSDLFSGKPLIWQPRGAGYLCYSVGINGVDEQGREDDPTIRMPLPEIKPASLAAGKGAQAAVERPAVTPLPVLAEDTPSQTRSRSWLTAVILLSLGLILVAAVLLEILRRGWQHHDVSR